MIFWKIKKTIFKSIKKLDILVIMASMKTNIKERMEYSLMIFWIYFTMHL